MKSDTFWYRYIYPKNLTLFEQPKLVAPEISQGGNFTYDTDGRYYSTTTVYGYIKSDKYPFSYYTLMAFLNSLICWWFISKTGTTLANGYYRFKPAYLKPFHIPNITIEDDLRLSNLSMQIISESDSRKREALMDEINALVFSLYQLDGSEIAVIKNNKLAIAGNLL